MTPVAASSVGPIASSSRGTSAFKPTRKPLAPITPLCDENAHSVSTPLNFTPLQHTLGATGSKRIPLAVKATYPCDSAKEYYVDQPPKLALNELSDHQESIGDGYDSPPPEKKTYTFFVKDEEVHHANQHIEQESQDYEDSDSDSELGRPGRGIPRPLRFVPVGENFSALTPITERMSECNSAATSRYTGRNQDSRSRVRRNLIDRFADVDSDVEDAESTPRANDLIDHSSNNIATLVNNHVECSGLALQSTAHNASDVGAENTILPCSPNMKGDLSVAGTSRIHETNAAPASPTTILAAEPCNPFAEDIVNILLNGLDPPLEAFPGFRSLTDQRSEKLEVLRKRCRVRSRKTSHSGHSEEPSQELELDGDIYFIHEIIGEGAYGSVFRVREAIEEDCTEVYENITTQKAMKVENPPNLYEFSILSQLHKSLPERLCQSIIAPHKLYAFADESFLMMDYSDQGTLLDIVNRAGDIGIKPCAPGAMRGIEELLAIFFTVELMRVVEGLHEAGYIHGDLKIDNCMVRLQSVPGGSKAWASTYDPDGLYGWGCKGLKLIDYGRSIDTNVFPPGQEFIVEWETDEYDCFEMRTGHAWTFHPDYHGIASIAYCMLFGSFMTAKDSQQPAFKRYHQCDLWTRLFDVCLRPKQMPNTSDLKSTRFAMERWLRENCERNGKSLKSFLKKIEVACLSR